MTGKRINISNWALAYKGALTAIAAVFGYSLIVMLYVIIRSSIAIYSMMPGGERISIILLNGFSVAWSVAVFSLVMALLSSAGGAVSAVILKKLLLAFNPRFNNTKAFVISAVTAMVLLSVMYLLLYSLLKVWMTFNYLETFAFWFLFPAVIFFVAHIIGGSKLNRILNHPMGS